MNERRRTNTNDVTIGGLVYTVQAKCFCAWTCFIICWGIDMNMLKIKHDVKDFLKDVKDRTIGYNVYLGGGYIRDVYYNEINQLNGTIDEKKPKDIDIFFVPTNSARAEIPTIPKTYINYDIMAIDIPNVRDNVHRVRGLFNSKLSTKDIQFIIYDKFMTIEQLANDMDTDINQAMYDISNDSYYFTESFVRSHRDKVVTMIHNYEEERMYSRIKRMQAKFPDYKVVHNISDSAWRTYESMTKKDKTRADGSFISD